MEHIQISIIWQFWGGRKGLEGHEKGGPFRPSALYLIILEITEVFFRAFGKQKKQFRG